MGTESRKLVDLSEVAVHFPDRRNLLGAVNLGISRGDRIALMGPSGSGKSTFLAVLAGLLTPDAGRVVWSSGPEESQVTWVFQQTFVLTYRTVVDNVAIAGLATGLAWNDAVEEGRKAVAAVGLTDRGNVPAGDVSGGERQRIGVARAIARNASLILADEPTANLDAHLVDRIAGLLSDSTPESCAVVVATHDERVAKSFSTRLELHGGNLVKG